MTDHPTDRQGAVFGDREWDERYSADDRIWSGEPNGALIAEIADLTPGRALDVGCGEGADAVWLASLGWRVTALDVSAVALSRARQVARDAGVDVEWVRAALVEADLPPGGFDLVSAQYPALPKTPGHETERRLLSLVAPGGTLLVVHHADVDAAYGKEHGFDPAHYVWPADVVAALDETWEVQTDERRPRRLPTGGDPRHTHDLVLRARRRAEPAAEPAPGGLAAS